MSTKITKAAILDALRRVKGPDMEGNIVDLDLVSEVVIANAKVYFSISVPPARAEELEPLREAAEQTVKEIDGIEAVSAVLTAEREGGAAVPTSSPAAVPTSSPAPGAPTPAPGANGGSRPGAADSPGGGQIAGVPGVSHIIAIASGKGGVGKSTTAVNLALAFQTIGVKTGLLDADVYGPSLPRLLGLSGQPQTADGTREVLLPMQAFGLETMSMGYLVDEATPVIWRGPMVMSALTQMLRQVSWGDLDLLVVDMPPGTGDAQLTMAQQVPLAGAVIVSTPQDLALIDARKGLNMFRKVNVPLLGIVENMSYFICPECGGRSDIFGHGGARLEAEKLGVPFLGEVPLDMAIRETSDSGRPVVVSDPEGPHAAVYRQIATKAWEQIAAVAQSAQPAPKIIMEQ